MSYFDKNDLKLQETLGNVLLRTPQPTERKLVGHNHIVRGDHGFELVLVLAEKVDKLELCPMVWSIHGLRHDLREFLPGFVDDSRRGGGGRRSRGAQRSY